MKPHEHTGSDEAADDGDLWLDQYPVEVLEVVLQVLKAQRSGHTASPQGHQPSL
jgi:hypothetical protein